MNSRLGFVIVAILLAGCISSGEPASSKTARRFSISDYDAVGDGKTVNTKAIQALIDRIAAQGGGTVVVPAGTFLTTSIFLKQGVNLHLEKDGVLKGTTTLADYPLVQTRWGGVERQWVAALVNFFDMTDAKLSGEGTIDGSGDLLFPLGGRGRGRGPTTQLGAATQPGGRAGFARGPTSGPNGLPGYARPRLIAFQNCRNATISGFKMRNEASWGLFVLYSENVLIENIDIRAQHNIPSSDGIDIDSSKNVRITGCYIDCNDDCIAIKSGRDEDGRRVNRPCEDIIVEKTILAYGHGGVSMGSEVSGGVRNVEIRDCVAEDGNWAPIRFKSHPARGGFIENITYRNIELKNARRAFEFNLNWSAGGGGRGAPPAPVLTWVRNVRIINVKGTATSGGIMNGLPDSLIDGVTFENCEITAAQSGLSITNSVNIDTTGLKMNVPESVQALVLRNATTKPAQ